MSTDCALQIAAARYRHRDVFHLHQIFQLDLARVFDDLRAALVAELFLHFLQFFDDDGFQHFFRTQDFQVFGDHALDLGQFVQNLLPLHAGQALQLQFDDGLRLASR